MTFHPGEGEDDYAAGSVLAVRPEPGESRNALLRRAAAALGPYAGEALRPSGARSTRFLDGEGDAEHVALRHPAYPSLNSWVNIGLGDFDPDGGATVFLTVHLDEEGDPLQTAWAMAETLTEQLIARLAVTVAHLTAWHLDGHGDVHPSTRLRPGSGLPEQFGAWTYVGAAPAGESCARLAALPVRASGPHGNGWLVRVVDRPGAQPPEGFREALEALKALDGEPTTYLAPRLDPA